MLDHTFGPLPNMDSINSLPSFGSAFGGNAQRFVEQHSIFSGMPADVCEPSMQCRIPKPPPTYEQHMLWQEQKLSACQVSHGPNIRYLAQSNHTGHPVGEFKRESDCSQTGQPTNTFIGCQFNTIINFVSDNLQDPIKQEKQEIFREAPKRDLVASSSAGRTDSTDNLIIRNKSKERPFECGFQNCGKNFKKLIHLKAHYFLHSGISDFKCEYCSKCAISRYFKDQGALNRHIRTEHTKEKPFSCQLCNRKFGRLDHFKVHMKTRSHQSAVARSSKLNCQ